MVTDEQDERTSLLEDSKHPLENLDLDRLLEQRIGEFGRYQKFIYLLVCLPAALTAAITLSSVFTHLEPKHRCQVPVCDSPVIPHYRDAFILGYANFTIPRTETGTPDSCNRFTEVSNTSCSPASFGTNTTACTNTIYDSVDMKTTIVTEYNLVCADAWKVPLSESIFFGGVLAGALIFGQLGDFIGRKKVFLLTMLQTLVCGTLSAFSPDYTLYSILQFLTAMGQVGVFQCSFVLGVELVGRRKRVFCGVFIEFFFVAGELILAALAWCIRDMRSLTLAYMIPSVLFLGYYFILPKSIRWLLMNRRFSEAEAELQKVARWNGVAPLTTTDFITFAKEVEEDDDVKKRESFLDLLRRPKLVLRLAIVFLAWIVTTMVYYGLSLNAASLAGDVFLNFTLLALTEIPGYLLSYLGMQLIGRKVTMVVSLVVSGVACLVSSLLPDSYTALQTACFLLGKMFVTSAFGTAYLYTSELFPTTVRNLCVGLSSMTGRIGAILSPYVVALDTLTGLSWLPMAVFAAGAIISGLATILLPETKGKHLPRTMEEAEALGSRTAAHVHQDDLQQSSE